ncbi:hypothetical protein FPV67DRAFT_1034996 [Lyophyllum atratum]|nr:hypothetical protein FPV67DRAFT_1034996 [Lyophyllum atratum]
MASRSDNSRQRYDEERPTLPPIRDLFHDLRIPQDSPSSTLARLRVSDDYEETARYASTRPLSSQGAFRPSVERHPRSETSQLHQYGPRHRHHDPTPSLLDPYHIQLGREFPASQRSLQPSSEYEAPLQNPRTTSRHPSPQIQEARGMPGYIQPEWSSRRHTSHGDPIAASRYPAYDQRSAQHPREDRTPIARYPPYSQPSHSQVSGYSPWLREVSTSGPAIGATEDERTPVARYGGTVSRGIPPHSWEAPKDINSGPALSKYECGYCGKGFNRPSSLKIHLNSHTGAKPFVCPVESCGRSFSVLSNMRRHARVHTQTPLQQADPSSDEESERSASLTGSALPLATPTHSRNPDMAASVHRRRSSTASISGASSRRSHASEEDSTNESARPEKRSRRHPK